jgi:DNA-binding transcriptional ArsR family regulator
VDSKTQARFAARAKIVKALAHPTRLFMVDQLSRRDTCVCKLAELVGADMSTVSKHLSVLKSAGIVADEKRGNQVFYRLCCPCLLGLFDCVESAIKSTAREQLRVVK